VTVEGPRFSTKAESKMFRAWGADIINMTTVPEVNPNLKILSDLVFFQKIKIRLRKVTM